MRNQAAPRATSIVAISSGSVSILRGASPLKLLGRKPEILELIGDYAGIVRGREARIIRKLTELLPVLF